VSTTREENPLNTALWLLVAQAGHHRCAGWTFEERDGLVRCACGAPLYELRTIDRRGDHRPWRGRGSEGSGDDSG
jgi:hypothetical protein